jgi:hypothetical protein
MNEVTSVSRRKTVSARGNQLAGICLILAGLLIGAVSLQATITAPPIVGWIADQRITTSTPGFQTQFFRMTNFAGPEWLRRF